MSLIGATLLLWLAFVGIRLALVGLLGQSARGDALRGVGGVVLLALVVAPCAGLVSNVLGSAPGCFNNLGSGTGMIGAIIAAALLGVVIVAGVLQFVRHRRSLDAWLRRPPTSRKKRVE